MESRYLIKENIQIAKFFVVTPEKSKHNKQVDLASFSMIPQGDPDLTAYLIELLRTNKLERQNRTFWFRTPENPGKSEDHNPKTDTKPQEHNGTYRERKTQSKREHRNPKEIPQTIRLD